MSGEMAGDIERRKYFVNLNMHQCRCLIADELYIKELKTRYDFPCASFFTHVISNLVFSTETKDNICMIKELISRRIS